MIRWGTIPTFVRKKSIREVPHFLPSQVTEFRQQELAISVFASKRLFVFQDIQTIFAARNCEGEWDDAASCQQTSMGNLHLLFNWEYFMNEVTSSNVCLSAAQK